MSEERPGDPLEIRKSAARLESLVEERTRELRESERKYRMLADYTYDWEFWIGVDGGILYMSPSCERVTGHAVADFVAEPSLLRRLVHPDDLAAYDAHRHDARGGRVCEMEFRIVLPNGAVRWISHTCQPVKDEEGRHLGTRGSNRDVTRRKEAEAERERLVLELREALAKVKLLSGFIPICASCKKIRNDQGYWQQLESYIRDHSEAEFSHGICPECAEKFYGEFLHGAK